jgi:hypothetical protein
VTDVVSIDGARSMAESFGEIGKTFLQIDDDPEAAALGTTPTTTALLQCLAPLRD